MFPYPAAVRRFLVLALVIIGFGCTGPEFSRVEYVPRRSVQPTGKNSVVHEGIRKADSSTRRVARPAIGQPVALAPPRVIEPDAQVTSALAPPVSSDAPIPEVPQDTSVSSSETQSVETASTSIPAEADPEPVLQTSASVEPSKPKLVEIVNDNDNTPPPIPGSSIVSRNRAESSDQTYIPSTAAENADRSSVPQTYNASVPPPVPSRDPAPASVEESRPMQANECAQLRALYRQAERRYAKMDCYIAHLRRREQVKGKDKPEELILFRFRKKPWSVHFTWLGIEGHRREVVYVQGKNGNLIHTLLAAGDMPLMPAGKRVSLAPDNIFVRSASRHDIREAGIGASIEHFGKVLDSQESGEKKYGTMKYLGILKRPEFEKPMEVVEQVIPSDCENHLPKGGSRLWMFDTESRLPLLVITNDHTNHEVEYYCYDRLQFPSKFDEEEFNPDKLWRNKAR